MIDRPTLPPGERAYVIGDIHGRADLLERMLALLERDAAKHPCADIHLIYLGDYIDRGPNSREVIERLMAPPPGGMNPLFLRGNHEEALLRFLDGDFEAGVNWLQFGGNATLASYGVIVASVSDGLQNLRDALVKKFPQAHKDFLLDTQLSAVCGDYYFTHAGIRPGVALADQSAEDLMWIREPFLSSKQDYGKIVVHGHSIAHAPEQRPNRIGIDTGAYATGCLTCLRLEGRARTFLTT